MLAEHTITASSASTRRPSSGRRRREAADFRLYAGRRDRAARERLIRSHLPLAMSVARRYDHGRVPLEDLRQVAAIGLINAVERFDPDHGAAFSSFAVPTIEGEVRRYFRDFTWTVRPPRDLRALARRIERERDDLTSALGRAPTAAELGERLGRTPEDIVEASEAGLARTPRSFDAPAPHQDDDGATLSERIGVEERGFAAAEASATADSLLASLTDRERLAVQLRFREDMTQTEIGRHIGCSQMHVSRILRSALAHLENEAAAPVGGG
jgi:RNA polymerase sigma-B factor